MEDDATSGLVLSHLLTYMAKSASLATVFGTGALRNSINDFTYHVLTNWMDGISLITGLNINDLALVSYLHQNKTLYWDPSRPSFPLSLLTLHPSLVLDGQALLEVLDEGNMPPICILKNGGAIRILKAIQSSISCYLPVVTFVESL